MATGTFYTIITFTFVFVFLLGLYGASTGLPQVTIPMNQLIQGWPQLSCHIVGVFFGPDCITTPFAIIGSALFRLGAMVALIYGIFTILNGYGSFPFLGWFFTLLMVILTIEGFVLFRHGRPT